MLATVQGIQYLATSSPIYTNNCLGCRRNNIAVRNLDKSYEGCNVFCLWMVRTQSLQINGMSLPVKLQPLGHVFHFGIDNC